MQVGSEVKTHTDACIAAEWPSLSAVKALSVMSSVVSGLLLYWFGCELFRYELNMMRVQPADNKDSQCLQPADKAAASNLH